MKIIFNAFLIIFLFIGSAYINKETQDVKGDFQKISKVFSENKNISFKMSYLLYRNYKSSVPIEVKNGYFKRIGDKQFVNIDGFLTLYLKDMLLVVDSTNKTILIGNPIKFDMKSLNIFPLDSMKKFYSNMEVLSEDKTTKTVKLQIAKNIVSPTNAISISYNKESYFVNKIVLFYREKIKFNESDKETTQMRLEVVLSDYQKVDDSKDFEFSSNHYIQKQKHKYVGVGIYKSYKILDQRYK